MVIYLKKETKEKSTGELFCKQQSGLHIQKAKAKGNVLSAFRKDCIERAIGAVYSRKVQLDKETGPAAGLEFK